METTVSKTSSKSLVYVPLNEHISQNHSPPWNVITVEFLPNPEVKVIVDVNLEGAPEKE